MTTAHQTVPVDLSAPEFERFEKLAERDQSAISYVVRKLAISKLPEAESVPSDVKQLLTDMESMSDEALQPYLDAQFTPAQQARSDELRTIWNTRPLTETEARESELLSDVASTNMLISSAAIAILVQRGHDLNEYLRPAQIA